jgi:hypothetical protein
MARSLLTGTVAAIDGVYASQLLRTLSDGSERPPLKLRSVVAYPEGDSARSPKTCRSHTMRRIACPLMRSVAIFVQSIRQSPDLQIIFAPRP